MGCYSIIFVYFWLLFCKNLTVDGAVTYANSICDLLNGNYTENSVYHQNLKHLLTNISSQSSVMQFRNITNGQTPDKVYGIFQCRQDLSIEVCTDCIKAATEIIVQKCVLFHEAVTWYEECMLRYANRPFFAVHEQHQAYILADSFNAPAQFSHVVSDSLDGVIKDAKSGSKFGHFATRKTNVSDRLKLYFLAQCTSDLDAFECNRCLYAALAYTNTKCLTGCIRAQTFFPSCHLRYDVNLFYNETSHVVLASPSSQTPTAKAKKLNTPIIIGIVVASFVGLLVFVGGVCMCLRAPGRVPANISKDHGLGETEVVQYDFETLKTATGDFKVENKLGEGGFGAVYKGTLKSGEIIAIKRLSGNSGQGANEFMAEAQIVAKLQHRNLVKLVGFCSDADEKLLAYEFMPNKSLDFLIFDPTERQRPLLKWKTRHTIIMGIARGLQYLHEDSRITIIHRDMKASNILLDEDMNPKIADFGLAKLFEDKQGGRNTSKIVGTFGYMAPEYMLTGEYSKKTDVYSFGIIVLEIVCGRKNRARFLLSPEKEDLPTYAWNLWNVGKSLEMMDHVLHNKCSSSEVIRCIQIGMLCVQGIAANRPTMTEVVLMLTGSITLPIPLSHALSSEDIALSMPYANTELSDSVNEHSHAAITEQDLYPR